MNNNPCAKKRRIECLPLDSTLENRLRPHQLEAVRFLTNRLMSFDFSEEFTIPLTGAVLADEMGTGKVSLYSTVCCMMHH